MWNDRNARNSGCSPGDIFAQQHQPRVQNRRKPCLRAKVYLPLAPVICWHRHGFIHLQTTRSHSARVNASQPGPWGYLTLYHPRRTIGGGKAGNEPDEFNNWLSICVAVTEGCWDRAREVIWCSGQGQILK